MTSKIEIDPKKYDYVKNYMRGNLRPQWIKFLKKLISPKLFLIFRKATFNCLKIKK
jgi:hypothetical protein